MIPFLQGSAGGINIGVIPNDNANRKTRPKLRG